MLRAVKTKNQKIVLLIARIFAALLALFFLVAFGPKLIGQYFTGGEGISNGGWEGWVMELTFYIFLIGYIFSWWRQCVAGVIFIFASVVQMGPFLIIDGNLGSLIFGIPLLLAGVLFLVACRV